jgi:hypothetical protein
MSKKRLRDLWNRSGPFRGPGVETKKKALLGSGLCYFCMRHSAEQKCFGRGTSMKPACDIKECCSQHARELHKTFADEATATAVSVVDYDEDSEANTIC